MIKGNSLKPYERGTHGRVPERTATQDKLQEANYFRHQLRDKAGNRDEFRWTLTAFIAAARSAIDIMRTEYYHRPGFPAWYQLKEAEMHVDPVLTFIHGKRNEILHATVVKVYGRHRSEIEDALPNTIEVTAARRSGSFVWTFRRYPNRDVMSVIDEVLTKLERLIQECMKEFGDPAGRGHEVKA